MIRRRLLCEGPEDLAALRELGCRVFRAKVDNTHIGRPLGAGGLRTAMLRSKSDVSVELIASQGAKSQLPKNAATGLAVLPDQTGAGEDRLKVIGVIFDPDDSGEETFHSELHGAIVADAPEWTVRERARGFWSARRRRGEHVFIRAVAWRGTAPAIRGLLPDTQCLERLLCDVLRRAHSPYGRLIERMLREIQQATGVPPTWKGAVHLWCAAIAPDLTPLSVAPQFLGQNPQCRAHVESALDATVAGARSLRADLLPLFR